MVCASLVVVVVSTSLSFGFILGNYKFAASTYGFLGNAFVVLFSKAIVAELFCGYCIDYSGYLLYVKWHVWLVGRGSSVATSRPLQKPVTVGHANGDCRLFVFLGIQHSGQRSGFYIPEGVSAQNNIGVFCFHRRVLRFVAFSI